MHKLLAKSDRQLGMCLRMLYDEGMPGPLDVHSEINDKGKMEFHVLLPVDDETFELFMQYHLSTCERLDMIGASSHTLDILRKV